MLLAGVVLEATVMKLEQSIAERQRLEKALLEMIEKSNVLEAEIHTVWNALVSKDGASFDPDIQALKDWFTTVQELGTDYMADL